MACAHWVVVDVPGTSDPDYEWDMNAHVVCAVCGFEMTMGDWFDLADAFNEAYRDGDDDELPA